MRLIQNISDDAIQTHLILFNETELTLKLRFFELTAHWIMDVSYKNKQVNGVKLSAGVLHLCSNNFPFEFLVTSHMGFDPFLIDDFSQERCKLYMLEPDEVAIIRGTPVEI